MSGAGGTIIGPGGKPMDPEQMARNRRVIVVVTVVFVAVSLFVLVWGYFITNGQREVAHRTDRALKSTAWAVLCYASQHEGKFPTSDSQLSEAKLDVAPPAGEGWPRTQVQALDGGEYMAPTEASEYVSVMWGPSGNLAPVLGIKTTVSGIGTVDQVNGWLVKYAQAQGSKP